MIRQLSPVLITKTLAVVLAASLLTACGGGGSSGPAAGSSTPSAGTASGSSVQTQSSAFSLSWVAPVTRSDGSPISLSEIEGYRVYYGTSAGNYTYNVNIADGSQTSATITGVAVGTYHVAMTTYDTNGLESAYSPEVVKTAP